VNSKVRSILDVSGAGYFFIKRLYCQGESLDIESPPNEDTIPVNVINKVSQKPNNTQRSSWPFDKQGFPDMKK
jgi:hypothetical protein